MIFRQVLPLRGGECSALRGGSLCRLWRQSGRQQFFSWCRSPTAHFCTAKSGEKPPGDTPGTPLFRGVGSSVHQRGNSPSTAAVRCQIHLVQLRLPPHERREKQPWWQLPPNLFAVHGAVVTYGLWYRDWSIVPKNCAAVRQRHRRTGFGVWQGEGRQAK